MRRRSVHKDKRVHHEKSVGRGRLAAPGLSAPWLTTAGRRRLTAAGRRGRGRRGATTAGRGRPQSAVRGGSWTPRGAAAHGPSAQAEGLHGAAAHGPSIRGAARRSGGRMAAPRTPSFNKLNSDGVDYIREAHHVRPSPPPWTTVRPSTYIPSCAYFNPMRASDYIREAHHVPRVDERSALNRPNYMSQPRVSPYMG